MSLSIKNLAKEARPRTPFKKISESILGKRYSLSLVLCGDKLSKEINKKYRKRNKPTNILSFPIEEHEGEIFLNLRQIKKESKESGVPLSKHTAYIFIHGLLHLKGFSHGSKMENEEDKVLRSFGHKKG